MAADAPDRIRAYFSLAPTEVTRDSLTRSQSAGYHNVPAYLLARLALDVDLRGRGYGGQVLVDALGRAARAADAGGGRLIVVDALGDEAAGFYRHFGFVPVKGNPQRLVLKVATVRALLS